MSTQYEVEHNIKPSDAPRRRRHVDMSTFTSHLNQIRPETAADNDHRNPHAIATPLDLATMFRLVQDQLGTLATDSPSESNRAFLAELMESLEEDITHPPYETKGVSQAFLDGLDRVDRKRLRESDTCPICAECYLDDPYCLVVELPCHESHRFDLECVAPWLQSKGTCPLCRKEMDVKRRKEKEPAQKAGEDDGEDFDDFYA